MRSGRVAAMAILSCLSVAPGAWGQARARVVDRIVATVNGRVITQSELELEARIALVQRGGVEAAEVTIDETVLKGALELSIGERLGAEEAEKLQAFTLEPGEINEALAAFEKKFVSPADFRRFLERHEADLLQLAALLTRSMRAEKLLESKLRLRAQVSESELRAAYVRQQHRLNVPFEQVREDLRESLTRQKYAGIVRSELAKLRHSADVRIIAPFARGSATGAEP